MYKNYFLFEKQINEIKPMVLGRSIQTIFTYQKNEIVLELFSEDRLFLLINISAHLPYLLLKPAYNVKQHKYQLFNEIHDQVICDLYIQPFDKQVTIELESNKIFVFFYGSQPNIFICDQKNSVINSFKTSVMPDISNLMDKFDYHPKNWKLPELNHEDSFKIIIKEKFAAFSNTIINEILFRYKQKNVKEINDELRLKEAIDNIKNEMGSSKSYIYRHDDSIKNISLIKLSHLKSEKDYTWQEFDSVNAAWQRFISEKTDQTEFNKLYRECASAIKKKIDYLNRSLKHTLELEDLAERKRLAELKGNLLLTFKKQINIDKNEVSLENIFSDNLETIQIKVNPNKSVSENAQIYFNKYKDIHKKQLAHYVKTKTLNHDIDIYSEINEKLIACKSLSDIKRIFRQLIDLNLILPENPSSNKQYKPQVTFKHLILEDDWQVYIGKSGENNDELTFSFANKQDYWFHAQGVPGSHVILKVKQKDQVPPHHLLEQVAGIAAANSNAKHSATVPVIYTQIRYVSRVRNAPKGTVNTHNEKILFVEPLQI